MSYGFNEGFNRFTGKSKLTLRQTHLGLNPIFGLGGNMAYDTR
jgi:hypothetical protein